MSKRSENRGGFPEGTDDRRIYKVRHLNRVRENIESGETDIIEIRVIEREARDLERLPAHSQFYWFSNADVQKTKEDFPDCKQIEYKEYNDYISNLKWLSENTTLFSKEVRNKAHSLLKDLCPRDFEVFPTQVEWTYRTDDYRKHKAEFLVNIREKIERGETPYAMDHIEREARDLESLPANKQFYFFSNADVEKTKKEFPDCKQIKYKTYNDYISALKWLSETTTPFSDKVSKRARSLLQDLCTRDFEFFPVASKVDTFGGPRPLDTLVGRDETPVALSIHDPRNYTPSNRLDEIPHFPAWADAGEATVVEPPVARRLGGRNKKSKRRKLSGRKLSGRKLNQRKSLRKSS
jgi:hypothetical protein